MTKEINLKNQAVVYKLCQNIMSNYTNCYKKKKNEHLKFNLYEENGAKSAYPISRSASIFINYRTPSINS